MNNIINFNTLPLIEINNFIKNGVINYSYPFTKHKKHNCVIAATYILRHTKSGKIYIGSSNNIRRRLYRHTFDLTNNKHYNIELQKLFNDNPDIQFYLILVNTREEAYEIEQWLLNKYASINILLNIAKDVKKSTLGLHHTNETRNLISNAISDKWKDPAYVSRLANIRKKWWQDNPMTPEMKLAKSIRLKDIPLTPERKIKALISIKKAREASKKICSISVMVDNIKYESITMSAKAHNITKAAAKYRIKSNNFPNWVYVN